MGEVLTFRDQAYLDILHHGLVLLRNFACGGRLEFCPVETEHLHEIPTLIGEANEHRQLYYLRGTRGLYLQNLRELCAAEYLERIAIWYAEPWRVLATAAGVQLPAWHQEAAPGTSPGGDVSRG